MSGLHDVTAVVLSLGEPYVARALESVAAQSQPPHDVIVVEHVSPFHRAIGEAARRVSTPFFLQVDADMVLDPDCLASLRAAMDARTGITCGRLRDPMIGPVVGVKLFRTELARAIGMRDSVVSDTDFKDALLRAGWEVRYLGGSTDDAGRSARTVGEHLPDYTPAYTFRKYLREGRRYRYRSARGGLKDKVARLWKSRHPRAPLAGLALAHGFFLTSTEDALKPAPEDPRAGWLAGLLDASEAHVSLASLAHLPPLEDHRRLRDVFHRFAAAGQAIAGSAAGATLRGVMASLGSTGASRRMLVARMAFGHGLLARDPEGRARVVDLRGDERALRDFLLFGTGDRATAAERIRGRAAYWTSRLPGRTRRMPW
jgi:hypothetical protein